jgi:signal transduction histidine kinase
VGAVSALPCPLYRLAGVFNFSLTRAWYGEKVKNSARAVSYFLSLAAIAIIFFSIEFVTEKFLYPDDEVVDILAAIIGALLFARCKRFFDRITDRIFFRGERDARAEFITNISHELQTPIAILRGNVELLQRPSITESERTTAERVIVSTLDGMSRLIGNVLESAKMKFSKKILCLRDVGVDGLLREAHEDCFLLAEDAGIYFSVIAPGLNGDDHGDSDGSGELSVRGDRDKLKEVLLNLISNAFKHTPRGGIVTLRAERSCAAALIIVEDSGRGISAEALPRIFERFYRIPGGESVTPGNGIGLNICKEIVEAHGGTISVESEVGKGTWFIISLPLAPPACRSARSSVSAIINS